MFHRPLEEAHHQHEDGLDRSGSASEPRHLEFDLLDEVLETPFAEAFKQYFDEAALQKNSAKFVLRIGKALLDRHGATVDLVLLVGSELGCDRGNGALEGREAVAAFPLVCLGWSLRAITLCH